MLDAEEPEALIGIGASVLMAILENTRRFDFLFVVDQEFIEGAWEDVFNEAMGKRVLGDRMAGNLLKNMAFQCGGLLDEPLWHRPLGIDAHAISTAAISAAAIRVHGKVWAGTTGAVGFADVHRGGVGPAEDDKRTARTIVSPLPVVRT
jgi:hypothetical protein